MEKKEGVRESRKMRRWGEKGENEHRKRRGRKIKGGNRKIMRVKERDRKKEVA